jgi:hypothetical protein
MVAGVAKMPVPMMRLKMSSAAEGIPIWRLFSRAISSCPVEQCQQLLFDG